MLIKHIVKHAAAALLGALSLGASAASIVAAPAGQCGGSYASPITIRSAVTGTSFVISSRDPAGVGFNDATPTTVSGVATTMGNARWDAYCYVARIWADNLNTTTPITVSAAWEALSCNAGSAVLGSASAWNGWRDFPNAPRANTWYPQALANKLAGYGASLADLYEQPDDGSGYGNVDIKTQFNVNLGSATCLAGSPFYLGTDGLVPSGQVNFVATLLHELGHGLGFALFTTDSFSGVRFDGRPSIWEPFMFDITANKTWLAMTDAERATSSINFRQLSWAGPNSVAAVPAVLAAGSTPVPRLDVSGPAAGATAGSKTFATAAFGPSLGPVPVTADIMPVVSNTTAAGLTGPGCGPLTAADALGVRGRIALIDRGVCSFAVKVKNAQNAGAIGVLIANTSAGAFGTMGGADATITIPALMVTFNDGVALKTALQRRSRTASGVVGVMAAALTGGGFIGADAFNRPLLYTPNPRAPGSSVSHWDTIATPNLLMEPFINADLTTILGIPRDLTLPLLKDLGW